jgi:sugar (pentulose or hexulose) kinase
MSDHHYLGIDLGSTSVTAVLIDADLKRVVATDSIANDAETTSPGNSRLGRSEWDINKMTSYGLEAARRVVERSGLQLESVAGIGVTGQQQGLQLFDSDLRTVGPFISWQDQRSKEVVGAGNYLDLMAERGGATQTASMLPEFRNTGCPLVTSYTASALFWLAHNGQLPAKVSASTAPEWLVSRLTGRPPVTDPTDAAGWGVFDVPRLVWNTDLIATLGLKQSLFPEIATSCTSAGGLTRDAADATGLPEGTPVSVASGDHQCAYAGTVADYGAAVAINVGTGGQSTVHLSDLKGIARDGQGDVQRGSLELRPFIDGGFLLAGVGVVGGRTLRTLRDFFGRVGVDVFGLAPDQERIFGRLVELAAEVRPDETGLDFEPFFTGTRIDAGARGSLSGIDPANFTPGHIANALFDGMAGELHRSYEEAVGLGAGRKSQLVGSGNGLRLNGVLRSSLESRFGMEVQFAGHTEEAGVGAALCASVASGAFPNIAAASAEFIRYED